MIKYQKLEAAAVAGLFHLAALMPESLIKLKSCRDALLMLRVIFVPIGLNQVLYNTE